MLQKLRYWLLSYARNFLKLGDEVAEVKILVAKALINQIKARGLLADIREAEFRVFSQFGEDGIIQYLISQAKIPEQRKTFVEFGVHNYEEANTRYLLLNNYWRGLVIDGSARNIEFVKHSSIYWRHDITAVAAFVNAHNINNIIADAGYEGEIGLLSIDIDGNDYWVWERLEVVNPIIVVVEYNSLFGPRLAVTVPYDPEFVRARAHYSHLYWGCSLKALELLARRKGYALVGSNSAGNNAFFIRRDCLSNLWEVTAEQAYVESCFRESRDNKGRLTHVSGNARLDIIRDLPVFDIQRRVVLPLYQLEQ